MADAAVPECLLVFLEEKTIHACCFQDERAMGREYGADAEIFPGLKIVLEPVFAE
jgi:hypothetical protein